MAADWRDVRSPETYLGYRQSTGFAQDGDARFDEPAVYAAPARLPLNDWGLAGTWTVAGHAAVPNEPGGRVAFQFHARDLNLVMGPAPGARRSRSGSSSTGSPPDGAHGTDVDADGSGIVDEQRTYQLIRQAGPIAARRFEIEFGDAGVEAYCFTFG